MPPLIVARRPSRRARRRRRRRAPSAACPPSPRAPTATAAPTRPTRLSARRPSPFVTFRVRTVAPPRASTRRARRRTAPVQRRDAPPTSAAASPPRSPPFAARRFAHHPRKAPRRRRPRATPLRTIRGIRIVGGPKAPRDPGILSMSSPTKADSDAQSQTRSRYSNAARRGRCIRRVRVVAHERLAVVKAAVIGDVSSRAVGGAFELGFDAGSIEETSKGGDVALGFAPTAVASRAPTSVRPRGVVEPFPRRRELGDARLLGEDSGTRVGTVVGWIFVAGG